jgi:hypothetical protein
MAKAITLQWKRNRSALGVLKNKRQATLSLVRNRIYHLRGNALDSGWKTVKTDSVAELVA